MPFQRSKIKLKTGNLENVTELWLSSTFKSVLEKNYDTPSNSSFGNKGYSLEDTVDSSCFSGFTDT